MVSIFFMILVGHLVFSIFSGSFALYNIFNVSASDAIQKCLDTPDADGRPNTEEDCNRGYSIIKGIAVTIFILVWLLEICTSSLSHEYRRSVLTHAQGAVSSPTTISRNSTRRTRPRAGGPKPTSKRLHGHDMVIPRPAVPFARCFVAVTS